MILANRLISTVTGLPLGWVLVVAAVLLAPQPDVVESFQLAGQPATNLLLGAGLLGYTVERRRHTR